jgi:hypothetical protein
MVEYSINYQSSTYGSGPHSRLFPFWENRLDDEIQHVIQETL